METGVLSGHTFCPISRSWWAILILKPGDLTDVAHLTRRTQLVEDLQRVRGNLVPYLTRGCFGTKTFHELSQDLFELGIEEIFVTLTSC